MKEGEERGRKMKEEVIINFIIIIFLDKKCEIIREKIRKISDIK